MRVRCGECEACKHAECGECKHCLGKKKFGGNGSSKFACIHRICKNMKPRNSEDKASKKKAPSASSSKKRSRSSRNASSTSSLTDDTQASRSPSGSVNGISESPASLYNSPSLLGRRSPTLPAAAQNLRQVDFPQHPTSLLDVASPTKKRKRTLLIAQRTKQESEGGPTLPSHMCGLSIPSEVFGVCANCCIDGDHDTIILCDGKGCGKEYHMKCCTPPLHEIPEGSFYCFDCSPKGSTAQLEEYLDAHDTEKIRQEDPDNFANILLHKDVLEEHHPPHDIAGEGPNGFPRSELDWIHKYEPDSLVGKAVRLYSPKGNHYHNGRIIDVRSRMKTDTECFVRFPAGNDARKTSLTAWISLEEHCVAVCTEILWAKFADRQWKRARLWSRSARELVPLMFELTRKDGAIRQARTTSAAAAATTADDDGDSNGFEIQKPDWGLIENILGTGKYEYVELGSITSTSPLPKSKLLEGRDAEIMNALANTELDAQNRIRKWRKLPLVNPLHPKAIRCQDESNLGPLEYQVTASAPIQPSPLIPQGLDRSYLLERVSKQLKACPTKDMATTLLCQLVDRPPSTIQAVTSLHREKPWCENLKKQR